MKKYYSITGTKNTTVVVVLVVVVPVAIVEVHVPSVVLRIVRILRGRPEPAVVRKSLDDINGFLQFKKNDYINFDVISILVFSMEYCFLRNRKNALPAKP